MNKNKPKIYFIINGFLGSEGTIKFIFNCFECVSEYWDSLGLRQEPKLILIKGFFNSNTKNPEKIFRSRKLNKEDLNFIKKEKVEQMSLSTFYLKRLSLSNLFVGTLSLRNFIFPNIGYIYDCQHLILKENFKKKEKILRTLSFILTILFCNKILVNSRTVKKDLKRFFPYLPTKKIKNLPFMPLEKSKIEKFQLNKIESEYSYLKESKFVLIANRWWKHKNHISVIRAFHSIQSILSNQKQEKQFKLVITGSQYGINNTSLDYQQAIAFIKEKRIEDKVHVLGHIDSSSLEYLYLKCCGLIQPTLFEGGPGGFCLWRAIDLSKKIACSDISINKELKSYVKNINFFNPYIKSEVCDALLKLFIGPMKSTKILNQNLINFKLEYAKAIIYKN